MITKYEATFSNNHNITYGKHAEKNYDLLQGRKLTQTPF
jgi:hypothetical protein